MCVWQNDPVIYDRCETTNTQYKTFKVNDVIYCLAPSFEGKALLAGPGQICEMPLVPFLSLSLVGVVVVVVFSLYAA